MKIEILKETPVFRVDGLDWIAQNITKYSWILDEGLGGVPTTQIYYAAFVGLKDDPKLYLHKSIDKKLWVTEKGFSLESEVAWVLQSYIDSYILFPK